MAHPGPPSTGWFPSSPCGPGCLPADDGRQAPWPRVAVRLAGLVGTLFAALAGVALLPAAARARWLSICGRGLLRAAGVRLEVVGELGRGGGLLVANHMSWIDVLAFLALGPVRLLAKQEVRDWPVIGRVAVQTGALFVDRAGLSQLPNTVATTASVLRSGGLVAVFPEGTTWCGAAAGAFRRAAFQAALDASAPVVPIAFELRLADGRRTSAAAFLGEETLWDALLRVLRLPGIVCVVTVLPALPATGDRRELARRAGAAVAAVTGVPHRVEPAGRGTGAVMAA
jgi:1-acyl-sn-glycerol-3-phosphate acyltransferase